MTWTNHTYEVGEVLASSKMTTFQDNYTALMQGHPGAPKIIEAAIATGAVKQNSLLTTTAATTLVVNSAGQSLALAGGTYSWWTASSSAQGTSFSNNDTAAGVLGLMNRSAIDIDFYLDERYIQASPPYNLGNGDVPLFVFIDLSDEGQTIRNVQIAPDPPWAYHGPTDISVHRADPVSGRLWGRKRDGSEVELTRAYKNSDMSLIPHPFLSVNSSRVCLLDPLSPVVQRLREVLDESGAHTARQLLQEQKKYLVFEESTFNTPRGVFPLGVRLK